jgi:hypothetical protein
LNAIILEIDGIFDDCVGVKPIGAAPPAKVSPELDCVAAPSPP